MKILPEKVKRKKKANMIIKNDLLRFVISDEFYSELRLNGLNKVEFNAFYGINSKFPTELTGFEVDSFNKIFHAFSDYPNDPKRLPLKYGCYLWFINSKTNISNIMRNKKFIPKAQYLEDFKSLHREIGMINNYRIILNDYEIDNNSHESFVLNINTFEQFMDPYEDKGFENYNKVIIKVVSSE